METLGCVTRGPLSNGDPWLCDQRTIEDCIVPTKDLAARLVAEQPTGDTPVHKIFRNLESGLGVQYVAAWEHVLTGLGHIFEVRVMRV